MTFDEALKHLRNEKKIRRTDWEYPEHANITLEPFYGTFNFFINGQYADDETHKIGYGLTYVDIESDKWEIYE